MKKNKAGWIFFFSFVVILLIFSFSFVFKSQIKAQTDIQGQSDAIGIRIVPNPNHYSVSRWYESQGYSGSPQVLTVDGYEAIRDGRTVYINVAHILPEEKKIYTNIYLISYNQDSNSKTIDILGQMMSHWKFNDNLPAEDSTCSISAIKCGSDVDCPTNQTCSLSDGVCLLKEPKACQVDDDCPANFFCDSVKAKIIRDLNRVGKIEELREALAKYREKNGNYPLLSAGTYLPGASISLWPSWQESFLPVLSIQQSFIDPINRLGYCPGYNNKTCWNKDAQQFIYSKEGLSLKLPADSYAMVYSTNNSGSEYNLCAVMESRDSSDPRLGYSLTPNDPEGSNCVVATGIIAGGDTFNTAPQITDLALSGISGREYNGFVRATDKENDPLFWNISTSGSWSGWSGAPIIKGTNDSNQKKIFAEKAGNPGTYPITIIVTDSKGKSTATSTLIDIKPASTLAEANEYVYRLDPVNPFNYSYYITGGTSLPEYRLNLISGPNVLNMSGIERSVTSDGVNRLKITHRGTFSTSTQFKQDTESLYTLVTTSSTDATSSNNFIIKVKIDKPILDFTCETQVRVGYDYSCRLGSTKQGNHTIFYSSETALPDGLEIIEKENEPGEIYLQGNTNEINTGQEIIIKAINEYGTENTKNFILRVNDYCGDGIKQTPNMEGKGGIYNNGYEACDGQSSVATRVASSTKAIQYACNTPVGVQTPYPIASYDYCIFKSPLDGGGYCGDTYCQMDLWPTSKNCSQDSDCDAYEVCRKDVGKCYYGEKKCDKDDDGGNCCNFDCDPNYTGPPPPELEGGTQGIDCSITGICSDGFACINGICQANCWDDIVTSKIQFKEGDATRVKDAYRITYFTWDVPEYRQAFRAQKDSGKYSSWVDIDNWDSFFQKRIGFTFKEVPGKNFLSGYSEETQSCMTCNLINLLETENINNCCIISIDNPICQDNTDKDYNGNTTPTTDAPQIACPPGYDNLTMIGRISGGDRCKDHFKIDNGCGSRWCGRYIYECSRTSPLCVGDPCYTEGSTWKDGTINSDGQCIKNQTNTGSGENHLNLGGKPIPDGDSGSDPLLQ
jgi:hypothetical protein